MKKIESRSNAKNTRRVVTINEEPTRTQQQFKDDVNVNNIMKRYKKTGQISHVSGRQGQYLNLSSAPDYFEAMQKIATANTAFLSLPSEVRRRFGNDPALLLEFIHDPKNYDEGVKLGLFEQKKGPFQTPPPNSLPKNNDELNNDENTAASSPAPKKSK